MIRDLLDDDGENLAVRAFLMYYGGGNATCPIISMRAHLARSGFDGCWPEWARAPNSSTLTKAGAQIWIRHLFSLESAAPTAGWPSARPDELYNSALRAEPASQQEVIESAARLFGVEGEWDPFTDAFRRFLGKRRMFLGAVWAPTPEQLAATRSRAEGGMHDDDTPISRSTYGSLAECEAEQARRDAIKATQGGKEGAG